MYNEALKLGGVAVVTGGANGVGLAAAIRFAESGLDIVLADLDENALATAKGAIEAANGAVEVTTVSTDVSDAEAVNALAEIAFARGDVAVLMNNAGVAVAAIRSSRTKRTFGA